MRGRGATQEVRRRIAIEAARLVSEGGLRDYRHAKEKAAARLGIFDESSLPRNSEVEDALREYQRLFQADDQPRALRRLREAAREAMRFFERFEPRLVGAVLEGTADAHSAVCLHLYTDQPNDVLALLQDRRVAYEEVSRRVRVDRATTRDYPALRFSAGDTAIDVTVLPYDLLRQAPLDRGGDRPMQRATLAALDSLLRDPAHG
jgi:hypothetical protein